MQGNKNILKLLVGVILVSILFIIYAYLKVGRENFTNLISFSGAKPTTKEVKLKIEDKDVWEEILKDVQWSDSKEVKLLNGVILPRDNIKTIKVYYTDSPQPYLTQQEGSGKPQFASVGYSFDKGTLTLKVYVSPERLNDGKTDKDWWIGHQVIHALNVIYNPNASLVDILNKDKELFPKYKGIIIWKNTIDL